MQRRSHHRRSRKRSRSVEDDDEGHLIYHSGDMLRARCIEYIPFFSTVVHTLSLTLLLSGFYFQTLIYRLMYLGHLDLIFLVRYGLSV